MVHASASPSKWTKSEANQATNLSLLLLSDAEGLLRRALGGDTGSCGGGSSVDGEERERGEKREVSAAAG